MTDFPALTLTLERGGALRIQPLARGELAVTVSGDGLPQPANGAVATLTPRGAGMLKGVLKAVVGWPG